MMVSAPEVNMTVVGGVSRIGQGVAILGAGLFHGVNFSTVLVVVGVIVWGVATWRKDSREVLRRQNDDVLSRNVQLEADVVRLTAALAAANDRPNIDKLYELMERHDRHAQKRDEALLDGFKDVGESVRANTEAVRLWATARASEGF